MATATLTMDPPPSLVGYGPTGYGAPPPHPMGFFAPVMLPPQAGVMPAPPQPPLPPPAGMGGSMGPPVQQRGRGRGGQGFGAPPVRGGGGFKQQHRGGGGGQQLLQQQQHQQRGRGRGKQPAAAAHPALDGASGQPASLTQLRTQNKRRARRHFHPKGSGPKPRDAPPAPDNSSSFLMAPGSTLVSPAQGNFHNVTPCTFTGAGGVWKQGFGSVDKEAVELGAAAGIDLQGTNAGIIGDDDVGFSTDDDEHMQYEDDMGGQGKAMDEQAAYIAELEERNMNLQEKVYLLEEQLQALQQQQQQSTGGGSGVAGGSSPQATEGAQQSSEDQQQQQQQQPHAQQEAHAQQQHPAGQQEQGGEQQREGGHEQQLQQHSREGPQQIEQQQQQQEALQPSVGVEPLQPQASNPSDEAKS